METPFLRTSFWHVLEFAREQGLLVTLNCGEVPNMEEINAMLDFLLARIGHAYCLQQEEWKKLKSYKIPVEICLMSNIRTETISSLDINHFVVGDILVVRGYTGNYGLLADIPSDC